MAQSSQKNKSAKSKGATSDEHKSDRLKAALKANLAKRKAQATARKGRDADAQ